MPKKKQTSKKNRLLVPSGSKRQTVKNRWRKRFEFWLDFNVPQEETLGEEIETLKSRRQFVKTLRDGIRLVLDLRRGRTQVLEELFPQIILRLREPTAGHDFERLIREIHDLKRGMTGSHPTPALVVEPVVDEEPEVIFGVGGGEVNPALNFLNSLKQLGGVSS